MQDINLDVTLAISQDISSEVTNTTQPINVSFGEIYSVEANNRVLYGTTATWNSQPQLISQRGYIYLYSDWKQNDNGQYIAGVKIGDGSAYLIDLPFQESDYFEHIHDTIMHITSAEREFWNNKVRCYIDTNGQLIFTTN